MTTSIHEERGESARPGVLAVQRRTACALLEAVERIGPSVVSAEIGHDGSTLRRWRQQASLDPWTAPALVTLMMLERDSDPHGRSVILDGLVDGIHGHRLPGRPLLAATALRQIVGLEGQCIAEVMRRLSDGNLTPLEARQLLPLLIELRDSLVQAIEHCRALGETRC